MAELADAADSKSADPCDRGGSTPPPGTNVYAGIQMKMASQFGAAIFQWCMFWCTFGFRG